MQTPINNINSQLTIEQNKFNSIVNSPIEKSISSMVVDKLLEDYQDLIEPSYKKWFAKRFYNIPFDQLHRAASEARSDGNDRKRYFVYLIKQIAMPVV